MPHVNPRRAFEIPDLRHRAPFPAIATVSADETMITAAPHRVEVRNIGMTPTQIGASVSAIVASLLIIGFMLYKFRTRKTGKVVQEKMIGSWDEKSSSSSDIVKVDLFRASPVVVEKPKAVYISESEANTTYEAQTGWVPQVKTYKGFPVTNKQYEQNMRYPRALAMWEKTQTSNESRGREISPPAASDVPRPGSPPRLRNLTPPAATKPAPKPAQLTISEPGSETHLPSPMRSASLPQTIALTPISKRSSNMLTNARLMTVCNTFAPTLSDEISVSIGESVRLMEEYDDGWCLVQRTGSDSAKGIIPRFCLTERRK